MIAIGYLAASTACAWLGFLIFEDGMKRGCVSKCGIGLYLLVLGAVLLVCVVRGNLLKSLGG